MEYRYRIGQKIKALRESKGFSIEHLANIADVDRNYLSGIEKGKRNFSIDVLVKLLTALELNFSDFFKDL
jgi:transcriptional regulator with XRE-family HTH domain